jgi:hypothetical protein
MQDCKKSKAKVKVEKKLGKPKGDQARGVGARDCGLRERHGQERRRDVQALR